MDWLKRIRPSGPASTNSNRSSAVPEGLWKKCPKCAAPLYRPELERNQDVCPKCGHHMRIGARRRLDIFLDEQGREEIGTEIVAHPFENLLIDCAHDVGASVIVRGLRAVADFEYEFQMVGMNRVLDSTIETVFLMAEARHQAIASKLVKEIARLDGDVSKFVTHEVHERLLAKLGK